MQIDKNYDVDILKFCVTIIKKITTFSWFFVTNKLLTIFTGYFILLIHQTKYFQPKRAKESAKEAVLSLYIYYLSSTSSLFNVQSENCTHLDFTEWIIMNSKCFQRENLWKCESNVVQINSVSFINWNCLYLPSPANHNSNISLKTFFHFSASSHFTKLYLR